MRKETRRVPNRNAVCACVCVRVCGSGGGVWRVKATQSLTTKLTKQKKNQENKNKRNKNINKKKKNDQGRVTTIRHNQKGFVSLGRGERGSGGKVAHKVCCCPFGSWKLICLGLQGVCDGRRGTEMFSYLEMPLMQTHTHKKKKRRGGK